MIHEIIQSLPQGATSIILITLLISILVIAYKVMEMVFETVTIAAFSGGFYLALTYIFSGGSLTGFKIDELLLFTFLGATIYMLYSFIISVISATSTIVEIPIQITKVLIYPFKKLWGHHKNAKKQGKENNGTEKEQSTKEVVLDKMKDEENDE